MVCIIRTRVTEAQIKVMLESHMFYVKLAVDIDRGILAGGGELHADCEELLLEDGSQQQNIWGATWNQASNDLIYDSMINLRPRQNRSMKILDPNVRSKVAQITQELLGL